MRSPSSLTVVTLQVGDNKLHNERLLQHGATHYLFLDRHLDLKAAGVGLGPNPRSVDHLDSFKTLHVLKAK